MALFKLFDGVLFFLSFYLIKIRLVSLKYRGDAHRRMFQAGIGGR